MTAFSAVRQIGILLLIITVCPILWAQEQVDLLQDIEEIRDPFKSQLPEPIVIKDNLDEQPDEVEPEHVEDNETGDSSTIFSDVPVVLPGPNIDAFVLKGLVWNTDSPQAIVNDKVVKVGDEVNGIRVVEIRKDGVEFSQNGVNRLLRISTQSSAAAPKP